MNLLIQQVLNQAHQGSPIFLKDSIKIIGIHKSGKPDNSENYGDFIGPIFQYFKNFSKNKEALNLIINDDIYISIINKIIYRTIN